MPRACSRPRRRSLSCRLVGAGGAETGHDEHGVTLAASAPGLTTVLNRRENRSHVVRHPTDRPRHRPRLGRSPCRLRRVRRQRREWSLGRRRVLPAGLGDRSGGGRRLGGHQPHRAGHRAARPVPRHPADRDPRGGRPDRARARLPARGRRDRRGQRARRGDRRRGRRGRAHARLRARARARRGRPRPRRPRPALLAGPAADGRPRRRRGRPAGRARPRRRSGVRGQRGGAAHGAGGPGPGVRRRPGDGASARRPSSATRRSPTSPATGCSSRRSPASPPTPSRRRPTWPGSSS